MENFPPTTTELILDVEIAQIPVQVRGLLANEEVELSGSVRCNKPLGQLLADLGAAFGADSTNALSKLAPSCDVTLNQLAFVYGRKTMQVAASLNAGASRCRFVLLKVSADKGGYVAGLELQLDKRLFNDKNALSGLIGEINLGDLGVFYASSDFTVPYYPDQQSQSDGILPQALSSKPRDFKQGFNLSAQLSIGKLKLLDTGAGEPVSPARTGLTPTPGGSGESPQTPGSQRVAPPGNGVWIEVDKSIGPLSVRRIGLSYVAPRAGVKLDASLKLSVLTLSFEGLGLSYPLDKLSELTKVKPLEIPGKIFENLEFNLDGAAVAFEQGPLTIAGGLLRVSSNPLQLDGFLFIRAAGFAIRAIGSYANLNGTHSFFVFAVLHANLGGDPGFFVTGLAFGLGVHRSLKLPAIEDVHKFPLVRAAMDEGYLSKDMDLRAISQSLGEYIPPSPGNIWIAAGIQFTSYGLVESFALLSVSFGTRFQIALLGLSRIELVKGGPVIARVEIAIRVVIDPDAGLLAVEARLTENSYILDARFSLRGGAAFYVWFAGPHAGDFVMSLGGYHPKFRPPAHYPKPDLVEFLCKIGDVTIQGHCYFALCPSAIMAGGGLSIVYQSGRIRAWFIVYADFLVQWKPLYYNIEAGISIGVALNCPAGSDVRNCWYLELSASAELYGPPLGGKVRISLFIISFTVQFGPEKQDPPALLWDDADKEKSFVKSFLPAGITGLSITDGLLSEAENGGNTQRFVSAHRLVLSCRSQVPVTVAKCNGKIVKDDFGKVPQLGVRPMKEAALYSALDVTMSYANGSKEGIPNEYIDIFPVKGMAPKALWANDNLDDKTPPAGNDQTMPALMGVEIRTKEGFRTSQTPALDLKILQYDRFPPKVDSSSPADPKASALPGDRVKPIKETILSDDVSAKRAEIVRLLARTGRRIMPATDIRLKELQEKAAYIYQAMPQYARVGQYPPRDYRAV